MKVEFRTYPEIPLFLATVAMQMSSFIFMVLIGLLTVKAAKSKNSLAD